MFTRDELADHLVAADTEYEDRERALVQLHHTTLPMLEDVGVIEYDSRSNVIRYRSDPLLDQFLSLSAAVEKPTE
ncbi:MULTISPECIES: hypothetical protein [Haladaptatus]|uniref:DUF7344 domain-containing protein n=1 Tax=Haladaptatus TaxID=367188 RepID=UPI000A9A3F9B|nr:MULTISPECIES: hypothetical protein [Haladaptatus]